MSERLVLQDSYGPDERGSPVPLTWLKRSRGVGPTRELAVRGELQREHLIAGEAPRLLVVHDAISRMANSIENLASQSTTHAYVHLYEADCWLRLKRPDQAVSLFEQA